jgi:glycosyltransferase involved in cell wall biosynthesis
MPIISVLMPVHNGALYIREAVTSVLSQTFGDFEFIIVDDGSTDETPVILKEYNDSRVRVMRLERKSGICRALNAGLAVVKGDFVARMDADDVCMKNRLSSQLKFMRKHPEVGLCGGDVVRFGTGCASTVQRTMKRYDQIRAFALFDNPFIHATVMLRRAVINEYSIRYDEEFVNAEDYELWTRIVDLFPCNNLRRVLVKYRVHDQNVTVRASEDMSIKGCRVFKRQLRELGLNPDDKQVAFHRQIGLGLVDPLSTDELRRAKQWLELIMQKNRHVKRYDEKSLKDVLSFVWYRLNYNYLKAGKASHRLYYSFIRNVLCRKALWFSVIYAMAVFKHRMYERKS